MTPEPYFGRVQSQREREEWIKFKKGDDILFNQILLHMGVFYLIIIIHLSVLWKKLNPKVSPNKNKKKKIQNTLSISFFYFLFGVYRLSSLIFNHKVGRF